MLYEWKIKMNVREKKLKSGVTEMFCKRTDPNKWVTREEN